MIREILWWYGAKRQYDMQKENGLAGLVAILGVIFIVWQWDNLFYPIFNFLGLVDLFDNAGLINENLTILSIINILTTLFVLMMLVAFITALPMFMIILLLQVFGDSESRKPTALQYAVSIVLLPFLLALLVLYKPLQWIGIIRKSPKSLVEYVKENQDLHEVIQRNEQLVLSNDNKIALADLYAIQQTKQNDVISCTKLTYDETVSLLNRAIPYLNGNKIYAFGFSKEKNKWYLLLNNPVPLFASKVILDEHPEESPFNYKKLYDHYFYYRSNPTIASSYRPHFYTHAVEIDFSWDETSEKITLDLPKHEPSIFKDSNSIIVDIDSLDYIVKLEGESIQFFYERAVDDFGVKNLHEQVHAYAYIIPLAYPEEEKYFTYQGAQGEFIVSYYKELMRVPNAAELSFHYKESARKLIRIYASRNFEWAIDFLKKNEQNNM